MRDSSEFLASETEFVSAIMASAEAPGQTLRAILDRYAEHNQARRSALFMALAGAFVTRVAIAKATGTPND